MKKMPFWKWLLLGGPDLRQSNFEDHLENLENIRVRHAELEKRTNEFFRDLDARAERQQVLLKEIKENLALLKEDIAKERGKK